MADTNDNPLATITNNSDVDVDIYDVFNETGAKDAILTYTKLGAVEKGQTQKIQTIHFASQLQAMRTGAVAALGGKYYHQFPVAVIPIIPLGSKKQTSYTVTNDDRKGMEQSFLFQKYAVANPDSMIAKGFFAALADSDQEKAVNKFFAGTRNFRSCSLASWTAVVTWSGQFTSAWQGPYYLYSVPEKGSRDTPALIATVNITSSASEDSAVLTMSASKGESTNLVMNGTGLQEANVGGGPLSVTLKPAWMNLVQPDVTSGKITTRYLIGSGLSGVINGITVFGTGVMRSPPDSKGGSDPAAKQRKEQQFDRTFSHVTTIIGLAVSMLTAYFFYKQLKTGHTQNSNRASDEAAAKPDATDRSIDSATAKEDASYKDSLQKVPETNPEIPKAAEAAQTEIKPAYESLATAEKTGALETMVDEQVEKLTDVLETEPPTGSLERTAQSLSDVQDEIKSGKLEEATTKLQDVSTSIETESKSGNWQQYEETALKETQNAVDEGLDVSESINDATQTRDSQTNEDPADVDLPAEEFDPAPVDPIVE